MDCVFCKIVAGEIPAYKIFEDSDTLAFLDISPLTQGHTVVVPKKHFGNILDLPSNLVEPTFLGVRMTTEMLRRGLGVEGFTIGINHGTIGHQEIDHLHVHIIPRRANDGGGAMGIESLAKNPSQEALDVVQKTILEANI